MQQVMHGFPGEVEDSRLRNGAGTRIVRITFVVSTYYTCSSVRQEGVVPGNLIILPEYVEKADSMRERINKHQEHSEQTYRAILETAYRLYLTNGIEGTTIQEIANEIGAHRTTVYRHFHSHEEICFAISRERHARLLERYDAELEPYLSVGTGWDKLCKVIEVGNRMAREHRDLFRFYALFDSFLALRPNQERVGRAVNATFATDKCVQLKKKLIEEGMRDGSVRDDIDPELASVTLRAMFVATWARVDMRYQVFKHFHGIAEPEQVGDTASRIYLDGMRPQKS